MSLPKFEDPTTTGLNPTDAIQFTLIQMLASVAMQELSLSHILNTQGENMQAILGTDEGELLENAPGFHDLFEANQAVQDTLKSVSQSQMFLMGKMSTASTTIGGFFARRRSIRADSRSSTPVFGRVLPYSQAGDTSDWMEIARHSKDSAGCDYSLIIRQQPLDMGEASSNYLTEYGLSNNYLGSLPYNTIKGWFLTAPTAPAFPEGKKLAPGARLRRFTVENSASSAIGSGPIADDKGVRDGFSVPFNANNAGDVDTGVAFALSYGEAAKYLSTSRSFQGDSDPIQRSGKVANSGFNRWIGGYAAWNLSWLRSPGNDLSNACSLGVGGQVYQSDVTDDGVVHPALWVRSSIFENDQT
ncbi:MAG: hypothetical protein FWG10_12260 [Eubacteriaceae bacterium]|nr:hypothetical protein [Eubacteriaceae bacterium]